MAQFQRHPTQKKVAKPFCKVCFDAGKSEVEYTSHFVKSEPGIKGKVVCPTLLNQAYSTPLREVQTFLHVTEQVWQPIHLSKFKTIDICARICMM